jgi:glucose-1-phosphate adenylyltransferase
MQAQADTCVMLLAGGVGSRLNVLGQSRAKPAIPFAGMYRIIDFTLSNVMNSGLTNVGVLTQYKPFSLMAHIGTGASWDFIGRNRVARILPPHTRERDNEWYRGTADAVVQNWSYVEGFNSKYTLILSGDHIYSMDYSRMIDFHREQKADLTLAVMPIDPRECRHFGMVHVDKRGEIERFEEKPAQTATKLASMGVYVFSTGVLGAELRAMKESGGTDFGKHVIPGMLGKRKLFAYRFTGYWRDVGTIKAYWDAHMDLFDKRSGVDLESWGVYTNPDDRFFQDRPPARVLGTARLDDCQVGRGCTVQGRVERSVLGPGVVVHPGAVVRRSVILHDTVIGAGAEVDYSVIDKDVIVAAGAKIGVGSETPPNEAYPDHLDAESGVTLIGKGARIPEGTVIGRNCIVKPGTREQDFESKHVPSGASIEPRRG